MHSTNTVKYGACPIRIKLIRGETYYSVLDFVTALTDSAHAKTYWAKLKKVEPVLLGFFVKRSLPGTDGKNYLADVATREQLLRIVQSIPSPKAEPIKQWLAGLGEEEQQRREDPEKGVKKDVEKFKLFMQQKGYSNNHIAKRIESIIYRKSFTDALKDLNLPFKPDYAKITTLVNKYVFNMVVSKHKEFKEVGVKENLREHMIGNELQAISLAEYGLMQAIKRAAPTTNEDLITVVETNGQLFSDSVVPGLKTWLGVDSLASPLSAKRDKNLLT